MQEEPFRGLGIFLTCAILVIGGMFYLSATRSTNMWDWGFRVVVGIGIVVGISATFLWRHRRKRRRREKIEWRAIY